jgi:hypothetical protein
MAVDRPILLIAMLLLTAFAFLTGAMWPRGLRDPAVFLVTVATVGAFVALYLLAVA